MKNLLKIILPGFLLSISCGLTGAKNEPQLKKEYEMEIYQEEIPKEEPIPIWKYRQMIEPQLKYKEHENTNPARPVENWDVYDV